MSGKIVNDPIVGHKTFRTKEGSRHEPLRQTEAKGLSDRVEEARQKRERDMPTEQDAIDTMFSATLRLKELGWKEAIYCPKDGSSFLVIESGSTGIHMSHYIGEWPNGAWWIESEDDDLWPSHPVLFREFKP